MILVLALIFSITTISLSYIRKSSKVENCTSNEELDKYFSLVAAKVSPQVCFKQLVFCASDLISKINEIEKEKEIIEPLFRDRIVSDAMYDKLNDKLKNLSIDKLLIESESKLYDRNCFNEAKLIKINVDKKYKISDDVFFDKKREALENELYKRLIK
ncbi:putative translocation protein sec66 [Vairimorpha apis BRL 01]|uniref:Putative translocation protein sec66 n=1 Tax=Vairimorpha apis BRL 01 TaxID=1037528 RepID=T0LB65_9MICR|nr:putative translocation protein sec66 [Vairimorpha apis BRL 01]